MSESQVTQPKKFRKRDLILNHNARAVTKAIIKLGQPLLKGFREYREKSDEMDQFEKITFFAKMASSMIDIYLKNTPEKEHNTMPMIKEMIDKNLKTFDDSLVHLPKILGLLKDLKV